jgi:hypothetical protein
VDAIARRERAAAVPYLLRGFLDDDYRVRRLSFWLLLELGTEAQSAVPALEQVASGAEDEELSTAAKRLLWEITQEPKWWDAFNRARFRRGSHSRAEEGRETDEQQSPCDQADSSQQALAGFCGPSCRFRRYALDRVQLVRNGKIVAERRLGDFDGRLTWKEKVAVPEPCWLAARSFGTHRPRYPHCASRFHFAHTNPLFVTVAGKGPRSPGDAARFRAEIDALIEFAPQIPTPELRSRALDAYRKARRYFAETEEK